MDNLYFVYIMKRNYLEKSDADLEDIRVYTVYDYALAELINENFYILSGNLKGNEIIRQEYYYDEDYFIIIDKKIRVSSDIKEIDDLFRILNNLRYKKLYKLQSNLYMTMYNVLIKVEDSEAIDYIRKTLKRNIKKESQKVISFSEIARNN